ncbi:hypothetical protein, partial [Thermobifida halotolerans]|uniref:hypothetical protein n=1 Tax=Thermobifida halotolerans TaxID=483545 RepID=UPI0018FF0B25
WLRAEAERLRTTARTLQEQPLPDPGSRTTRDRLVAAMAEAREHAGSLLRRREQHTTTEPRLRAAADQHLTLYRGHALALADALGLRPAVGNPVLARVPDPAEAPDLHAAHQEAVRAEQEAALLQALANAVAAGTVPLPDEASTLRDLARTARGQADEAVQRYMAGATSAMVDDSTGDGRDVEMTDVSDTGDDRDDVEMTDASDTEDDQDDVEMTDASDTEDGQGSPAGWNNPQIFTAFVPPVTLGGTAPAPGTTADPVLEQARQRAAQAHADLVRFETELRERYARNDWNESPLTHQEDLWQAARLRREAARADDDLTTTQARHTDTAPPTTGHDLTAFPVFDIHTDAGDAQTVAGTREEAGTSAGTGSPLPPAFQALRDATDLVHTAFFSPERDVDQVLSEVDARIEQ